MTHTPDHTPAHPRSRAIKVLLVVLAALFAIPLAFGMLLAAVAGERR